MTVISITTDFGIKNEFVAVMKGVMVSIAPGVQFVDVTHSISPQNVHEGAFALWRAYSFFPKGTVHLFVVDPGVGTARRPMAAQIGDYLFVGPDNGLLTPIIEDAEREHWQTKFVLLENPKYRLAKVSRTFHGRDIFSPAAAHLANGIVLEELGPQIHDPIRMDLSKPEKTSTGWTAHVTVIDTFGNLTLDLPASALQNQTDVSFRINGVEIHGVVDSYGHRAAGELVAVVDSEDFVEIAVVNGNASARLNAGVGNIVEVDVSV